MARLKASEKQDIAKKTIAVLKKEYPAPPKPTERSALEWVLYSGCLEDVRPEDADAAIERLGEEFFDDNELRVSTMTEVEEILDPLPNADRRALRIRSALQYVFELDYSYDLDWLRKNTLEKADGELRKIPRLSDILQQVLGSHVFPIDGRMMQALAWLGWTDDVDFPGEPEPVFDEDGNEVPFTGPTDIDTLSDALKPAIRKAETPLFCHYLRFLATDPQFDELFAPPVAEEDEEAQDAGEAEEDVETEDHSLETSVQRLKVLLGHVAAKSAKKATKKSAAKKPAEEKKPAAKKSTAKKAAKKSAAKSGGRKKAAGKS